MKKLFYLSFLILFGLSACQKADMQLSASQNGLISRAKESDNINSKVSICHVTGKDGKFNVLEISMNALATHLAHGDRILDADRDGFTATGACTGSMNDCDDNDASVHPGAAEICGDGKDNNCNGTIDEGCGPDFTAFYIRNSNSTVNRITPPWDSDIVLSENSAGDGFTYGTPRGGQKVGYGTKFFDGVKINTLETVNWSLIFGNSGIIPYLNIWVTDGNGNYAVISSENNYQGTDFAARREWKIFEYGPSTSNFNWLFAGGTGGRDAAQYLTLNGTRVTLSQLADNIIIGDPGLYPAPNVGTGAPRGGYGFNLIWGDTQANFAQKNGQIGNLSVTVAGITRAAKNP